MKCLGYKKKITGNEDEEWSDKLQQEYEALEKRNQKELDKLMDLLKENPDEALKYAIPLDNTGSNRGPNDDNISGGIGTLSQRWNNFSLLGNMGNFNSNRGSSSIDDDIFHKLENQYRATAEQLIAQKKYRKAAFVYLKLLKQYHKAAETLEAGGFHQEAATIYIKYCHEKSKAAACYRRGNMLKEAIKLYKELKAFETVGDLYLELNQRKEADFHYNLVIEQHANRGAYVKAALLCKTKMNNLAGAQTLLLIGWNKHLDSFNCLNNYFNNISDLSLLESELKHIYQNEVGEENAEIFLQILKYEYNRKNKLALDIRDMAYEIIAQLSIEKPSIVNQLKTFNDEDKQLNKDILRYKLKVRQKK